MSNSSGDSGLKELYTLKRKRRRCEKSWPLWELFSSKAKARKEFQVTLWEGGQCLEQCLLVYCCHLVEKMGYDHVLQDLRDRHSPGWKRNTWKELCKALQVLRSQVGTRVTTAAVTPKLSPYPHKAWQNSAMYIFPCL